jgi:glycosyltransferase involved in cell wall biosynthesis
VEPRNEKALAAAVVKLIESPSLRAEMGRKGREYVLSRYRWEDCTAKMEALYQRLVRERASLPLAITC